MVLLLTRSTIMKQKLFSLLAIPALSLMAIINANATQKIIIKSELASPIVLEDKQDKNYLKVSLTGFPININKRSPINLALVIDRSTSMHGDRIAKARDAAIMTVNMLNSNDTLSVITYDNTAEVIIPASKVQDKEKLINQIKQNINPRGMTALFAGVSKGIDQVNKHLDKEQINRIILLSDGQANTGPTSIKELSELAKIAAKKGISISTIGIGEGYNEDLMTAIANYSDGNHAFVANTADLEGIFAKEFKDVMSVVAQDVEVTIKTADNVKPIRLLGREGEITGNTIKVKLNQLYANQEKYVLLEVVPATGLAEQQKDLAKVQVSYNNLSTKKQENYNDNVTIRYSKSADAVKKAQVDEIIVDSAIQKVALENERAIELMDKGQVEQAKVILQSNAVTMEALPVNDPTAKMKAEKNAIDNKKLLKDIDSKSSAASRKSLKESSYKIQKQQQ